MSNLLRIFGILVLALVVFAVLNKISNAGEPLVKLTNEYLTALRKHDVSRLQQLSDLKTTEITLAGNRVTGIRFSEVTTSPGAFSLRSQVLWTYTELAQLTLAEDVRAEVSEEANLASVPLSNGGLVFLHRIDGDWKVFYIAHEKEAM